MPEIQYQNRTIPQVVAEAAATYGERLAISDGPVQLSYAQLDAARVAAARAFVAAGLQKGDRIAIWAPNIYQWILAAIGAQSVGGVLVPLNTRLAAPEWSYIVGDAQATVVIAQGDFVESIAGIADQLESVGAFVALDAPAPAGWAQWESWLDSGDRPDRLEPPVAPEDAVVQMYTSGTTGRPKGAVLEHRALMASIVQSTPSLHGAVPA